MDADASLESGLELKTKKVFEANLIFVIYVACVCHCCKKVSTVSGDVAMARGCQDIYQVCTSVLCRLLKTTLFVYLFLLLADKWFLYQVAREGKVDELLSLVQLESLENIRTWVNRWA